MQAVHPLDEIANPHSQATPATLPAKGILIPINSIQLSNHAHLGNAELQLGIVQFPLGEEYVAELLEANLLWEVSAYE